MIRVILFLVLVGLIALGAVWVADRPGEVAGEEFADILDQSGHSNIIINAELRVKQRSMRKLTCHAFVLPSITVALTEGF